MASERSTELIAGAVNGGGVIVFEIILVDVFVSVVEAVAFTTLVTLMTLVTVGVKFRVIAGTLGSLMPDSVTVTVDRTVTFRTDVHHGV